MEGFHSATPGPGVSPAARTGSAGRAELTYRTANAEEPASGYGSHGGTPPGFDAFQWSAASHRGMPRCARGELDNDSFEGCPLCLAGVPPVPDIRDHGRGYDCVGVGDRYGSLHDLQCLLFHAGQCARSILAIRHREERRKAT